MAENIQPNSVTDPNKAAAILQYAAEYAAKQSSDLDAVAQATYNYAISQGVSEVLAKEYAPQFAQYFIAMNNQNAQAASQEQSSDEEEQSAENTAQDASKDDIDANIPYEEFNPNADYTAPALAQTLQNDDAPVLLEEMDYSSKPEDSLEDLGSILLEEPVYQAGSATKTDVEDEDLASILLSDDTYDDSNRERKTLDDDIAPVLLADDTYDDSNRRNTSLDDMEGPVLMAEMTAEEKTGPTSDELLAQDTTEEVVLAEDSFDDKAYREQRKKDLEESLDNDKASEVQLDNIGGDDFKSTYVRKQTQDEIEAKKKTSSAAYKAKMALGDTSGKVSEESRRMYRALKAEQNARLAKKGMFMIFIVFLLGVASAVLLWMFINYTPMPEEYESTKVVKLLQEYSDYYCAALGFVSLMTILRLGFIKSLASLMYVVNVVLMIPCFTLLSTRTENSTLNTVLYVGVIVVSMFNCFFFNTSDAIEMYYKRKDTNVDY